MVTKACEEEDGNETEEGEQDFTKKVSIEKESVAAAAKDDDSTNKQEESTEGSKKEIIKGSERERSGPFLGIESLVVANLPIAENARQNTQSSPKGRECTLGGPSTNVEDDGFLAFL